MCDNNLKESWGWRERHLKEETVKPASLCYCYHLESFDNTGIIIPGVSTVAHFHESPSFHVARDRSTSYLKPCSAQRKKAPIRVTSAMSELGPSKKNTVHTWCL